VKVVVGVDDGGHDCCRLCVDLDCVLLLLRCGFMVLHGARLLLDEGAWGLREEDDDDDVALLHWLNFDLLDHDTCHSLIG